MLVLQAGPARLALMPEAGAAFAALTVDGRPALHPVAPGVLGGLPAVCHIVLLPFSNRIGGGRVDVDGVAHALPANVPGEADPLHGDAFQRPWRVAAQAAARAVLELPDGAIGPWRYRARLTLRLSPHGLLATLALTSASATRLPFGCGFHPWFPRSAATRLCLNAGAVWLNDAGHLSLRRVALADRPEWDFRQPRPLPPGLINNGFVEWDRRAAICQAREHVSLRLSSSMALGTALLYSPGEDADFFCLEPVSHPINAHQLPGRPGLAVLAPGQSLQAWMRLDWHGAAWRQA